MPIRRSGPNDFWVVVGLTLMLALPAWLTLRTVQSPRQLVSVADNPTPLGYTWSLLLFLIPTLAIGWKVMTLRESSAEKKAFWLTMALLIPAGFALDVFFGMTFFTFENKGATLGWNLPGYVRGQGFRAAIPIEEFAFYALGFVAILLTYVWADRVWMRAYNAGQPVLPRRRLMPIERWPLPAQAARRISQRGVEVLRDNPAGPVVIGALLFLVAWWVKRHGPVPYREGIPGYFLFLLAASIVPSAVCCRVASRAVNWRAFGFSLLFLMLISMFWEATLGVPYQWWGYRKEPMIGFFIGAFCDLPLEAVLVWIFANWATVLIYETILLALQTGVRPLWRIILLSNAELSRLLQAGSEPTKQ